MYRTLSSGFVSTLSHHFLYPTCLSFSIEIRLTILPSAPAPSTLSHASNLDWQFVSHMIIYMFQCHSPKSSPLSLSHRVQKTVLYICVSFAVSHTGLSLPSFYICYLETNLMNSKRMRYLTHLSICVSIVYWCFSFWLTSVCIIGSTFIHLIRTDSNVFFLMAE